MSENKIAISVEGVKKIYKLYQKPFHRVLDALGIGRHRYTEHEALKGIDFAINKENVWVLSVPMVPVSLQF